MELVPWLIFAAIALFFDVAVGWAKRKAESRERETRRPGAWREYGDQEVKIDTEEPYPEEPYEELYTDRPYAEQYQYYEGRDALESPARVEVQTYDEEDRRPVVLEIREPVVRLMPAEVPQQREPVRMRVREETQIAVTRRTHRRLMLDPVTARQAIVWMEVLGTPKGLRPGL